MTNFLIIKSIKIIRNRKVFILSSQPGANAPQFEPFAKNKTINPKKGAFETEIGNIYTNTNETENGKTNSNTIMIKTASEEFKKYSNLTKTPNKELKTESREELNIRIESKSKTENKQIAKTKTKNKTTPPTIQKFSNHIKFIDYIPTHEIITYRHLFAYGFYVE